MPSLLPDKAMLDTARHAATRDPEAGAMITVGGPPGDAEMTLALDSGVLLTLRGRYNRARCRLTPDEARELACGLLAMAARVKEQS